MEGEVRARGPPPAIAPCGRVLARPWLGTQCAGASRAHRRRSQPPLTIKMTRARLCRMAGRRDRGAVGLGGGGQ